MPCCSQDTSGSQLACRWTDPATMRFLPNAWWSRYPRQRVELIDVRSTPATASQATEAAGLRCRHTVHRKVRAAMRSRPSVSIVCAPTTTPCTSFRPLPSLMVLRSIATVLHALLLSRLSRVGVAQGSCRCRGAHYGLYRKPHTPRRGRGLCESRTRGRRNLVAGCWPRLAVSPVSLQASEPPVRPG